jgi:exosortase
VDTATLLQDAPASAGPESRPASVTRRLPVFDPRAAAPWIVAALAFVVLYWEPMRMLAWDWWNEPDAGHGLLLAPLALFLAWKKGVSPRARPQVWAGIAILFAAVSLRYASGLAAEFFTMRLSLLGALGALVVYRWGFVQLRHWWLASILLLLAIPLPQVVLGSLALPLQFQASRFGAAMLDWRHVPVLLQGNVIHIPGQTLFVTEACSGLRSLTALLALGVLIGGLWLQRPTLRWVLVLLAIPIAMLLNGLRIFITGFLVYFIDPSLGEGIMHYTEGWAMFVAAFGILSAVAWCLVQLEKAFPRRTVAA